jgi:hypothetical protein
VNGADAKTQSVMQFSQGGELFSGTVLARKNFILDVVCQGRVPEIAMGDGMGLHDFIVHLLCMK